MNKNSRTVKKVLKYIGKYKLLMLLSAILAIGIVALTLYVPILIGKSIDLIIGKGLVDLDGITKYLTTAGILILATALMQWIMSTIP